MSEETLLSVEEPRTRAEIAAQLRSLADGFDDGGPLTVAASDQVVTVTPPDRPEFELEVERECDEDADDGDRSGEISIEVEIEWEESDVDADVDVDGDADTESEAERADAEDDAEIAAPIDPNEGDVPTAAAGDDETVVSQGQFQLYADRGGKWRWRLVHRNGNIIAVSGQGYASRQKAEQGMASVMRNAPDAKAIAVE